VAAGHNDLGAFIGEGHSGSTADAGERASNENNLICHLFPSAMAGNPQIR
jgi:hypothetical protein